MLPPDQQSFQSRRGRRNPPPQLAGREGTKETQGTKRTAGGVHARERDALDRRYNVGQWTHWYDRNIVYPYSKVTPGIEAALRLL